MYYKYIINVYMCLSIYGYAYKIYMLCISKKDDGFSFYYHIYINYICSIIIFQKYIVKSF